MEGIGLPAQLANPNLQAGFARCLVDSPDKVAAAGQVATPAM